MQTYHRRCINDCVGKSIELGFTNLLEAEDDITKGVYLCVWISGDCHSASSGLI